MKPCKVHILTREYFGDMLLGPQIRLERIAEEFRNRGYATTIYGHTHESSHLLNRLVKPIHPGFTQNIDKSDIIIASELIQARPCRELLGSRLRFHWDCYGLSLPETISFLGKWSYLRSLADRRRKLIRYRLLASRAESVWVSNREQSIVLASLLATSISNYEASAANLFPSKVVLAPMGAKTDPFPQGSENPYPSSIQNRPIFLWGGGIWQWFDVETVLKAMVRLQSSTTSPVLFFISGRNEATKDYDAALESAIATSKELGLLGKSVFFNEQRVSSSQLAPWLEHCTAGIMGSPNSFETMLSWRTRYLDLIWAGKPLVTCGHDPFAEIMVQGGAALVSPSGDSLHLAAAIEAFSIRDSRYQEACAASRKIAERHTWPQTLRAAIDRAVSGPPSLSDYPNIPFYNKLRYLLGI